VNGIVVAGALLWDRRRPERATVVAAGATVAISVLGGVTPVDVTLSFAAFTAFGVLAFIDLRYLPTRLVGPMVAAVVGSTFLLAARTGPYLLTSVFLTTVYLAPLLIAGGYLRWLDWRQQDATRRARGEERLELARDLHDVVAHHVTGIVVQAQAAQLVAEVDPVAANANLPGIERAGRDALDAMRDMIGSLRSPDPAPVPLQPVGASGLHDLVAETNRLGTPTRLVVHGLDPDHLPAPLAASVLRMVQEALTNVRRHGVDVTDVEVGLTRAGGDLLLDVRDDGRWVRRSTRPSGFGLVGMEERARALGGELAAGPVPTGGWLVRARLPLAPHGQAEAP
jgi:signal transduction histidine kinase